MTTSTSHSRKLERIFAEISSATFENLCKLVVISNKINTSCTTIRISHKNGSDYLFNFVLVEQITFSSMSYSSIGTVLEIKRFAHQHPVSY